MKKKLIATMVAGAVLSTGLIALTACGGGLSINKGEEVDAAGWKAAITATCDAKNYTVESYAEMELKAKGSYEGIKDELGADSVDMNVKSTGEGKNYYDLENNTSYSKGTTKVKASGVPEGLKDETEYQDKDYSIELYSVKDGDTYYMASYNTIKEDAEWEVYGSPVSVGSISDVTYVLKQTYATEKDGTVVKSISDLYESFTYSSGVYTATLYRSSSEYTISIAVKGGYVVGYSMEVINSEEDEGFTSSESIKYVYNFSDYGKTTVNPSNDAKKAIEDYKAK